MSVTVLKGSLETFALLLFLKPDKYITSKKIRGYFKNTLEGTLYMRLQKLIQQELVVKLKKRGNFAGDDRSEYALTPKGKFLAKELLDYNLEILKPIINTIIKQKLIASSPPEMKETEDTVRNFLMDFSQESSDFVDHETIKEQTKILEKLLTHYY